VPVAAAELLEKENAGTLERTLSLVNIVAALNSGSSGGATGPLDAPAALSSAALRRR